MKAPSRYVRCVCVCVHVCVFVPDVSESLIVHCVQHGELQHHMISEQMLHARHHILHFSLHNLIQCK